MLNSKSDSMDPYHGISISRPKHQFQQMTSGAKSKEEI